MFAIFRLILLHLLLVSLKLLRKIPTLVAKNIAIVTQAHTLALTHTYATHAGAHTYTYFTATLALSPSSLAIMMEFSDDS